jgi:alpha-galactosidase/6-phospho-beta-glucosidase family protein
MRAFLEKDRKYVYHAAQMDQLVFSQISLPEIRKMGDEMFDADQNLIGF